MVLLLVFAAALLQIPSIQTRATQSLTDYLSENTGYRTEIQRVHIRWWDAVSLKNVRVYDLEDSLMANLEEVYVDFSVSKLMDKRSPGFDEILLRKGTVRILTHPDAIAPNISTFLARITDLTRPKEPSAKRGSLKFNIEHIALEQTSLDILNYKMEAMESDFDYGKLRFRNLTADADDFLIQGDTIALNLNYMTGLESTSGMAFQQLRTDFIYSNTGMEFKNLYLKSNETEIKDYLRFTYDNVTALNNFNADVNVFASLDEAVLDIGDLRYFSPLFPDIDDRIYLSGDISGKVSDLFSDQLLVRFGERSALFGKFHIEGLPNVAQTYFDLSLMNSILTSNDLSPYISSASQKEVDKFREFRFDADFEGYLTDFKTNGAFRTGIGRMSGNLNYQSVQGTPTYSGRIQTDNLDLGVVMEDRDLFQKISLNGQIKGTGLTVESAILELQADVDHIGVNQYNYSGIETNATYGKDLFNGMLNINDPNLKMTVNGTLDLRNQKDSAQLVAKLDTAFLNELNLIDTETFVSGSIALDTKGITLDEIQGSARFADVKVVHEGRELVVDKFIFQSLFTDNSRLISLNSDLLVAGISGNFKIAQVGQDIQELWKEYYSIVTSADVPTSLTSSDESDEYSLDINVNFRDPNPIINLLDPSLSISNNTQLEGAFYRTGENTVFNLFSSIDTIYFKDNYFLDNNIDFNTSKIHNSKDVLAAFYIFSKNQQLNSGINFHNFSLEAIWNESVVDLNIGLDQLQTESYARINSIIDIAEDSTTIVFEPSDIKLLERHWKFEKDNFISISRNNIRVNNVMLFNENQFLSANGNINQNPEDFLFLRLMN